MKNKWKTEYAPESISSRHSIVSAIFYLDYFLDIINTAKGDGRINRDESDVLKDFAYIYSYIISRHHSDMNNLEYFFSGLTGKNTEGDNSGKDAYDWYEMFKQELYKEPVVKLRKRDEWLNRMAYQSNEKNIYLYAWTRLLYSLLVAADYYATSEFMNGYENNDYGNVNNIDNIINEYENNDVQKSIRNYEKNIKRLDEEQLAKVNKDTVIGNINLELLTNNNAKAVRLINNREKYFNHRMFANRVKVNYELLNRKIEIAELEEHILQHKNKRILIEFIRKSSAEEFYAYISESAECPVRLITGDSSIQERKDIIADIENMQEVILVATQVIEAGVDIDMDIGYKDISRLDSEEQFIGRINRSCRKDGVVYFFNMDDAKGIYRQDVRVDTDNTLMNEEIREVLNSKDFYDYYEKYVIPVLKNAQGQCNDNNIDEFIRKEVGKLDFNKVADKMKLIDDNRQMYSIYFSRNIIDKNNPENVIDGKKIWEEYKELLQDNYMSYQEKTVKLHNIRSEMNMFMYQFKIELYNEKHKPVVEHLEWNEQIGDIFYVENGEDYYDENGVLNKELFKDNEDLFI